jgi:hypothetical protein
VVKYFIFIFIAVSLSIGCKSDAKKTQAQKQSVNKNFFPVADYIASEINYVDSLPLGIVKYSIHGTRTDSSYIQTAEFNQLAEDFKCEELRPAIFENEFSETSFIDETTESTTFTYSTKNDKLKLYRVDVLATADEGSNKVSSIYLEKAIHSGDTVIIKKLLWRTKKSFQIVTSKRFGSNGYEIEQLKVVWDPE